MIDRGGGYSKLRYATVYVAVVNALNSKVVNTRNAKIHCMKPDMQCSAVTLGSGAPGFRRSGAPSTSPPEILTVMQRSKTRGKVPTLRFFLRGYTRTLRKKTLIK